MMTALHYCHLRHHHHGHHDHDCCRHHHHHQHCQKHPPPQQDHHQHRSLIIHHQHSNCIQASHRIVVPGICIAPSSGIICNVCNTYFASHRHLYKHTRYNWYKLSLVLDKAPRLVFILILYLSNSTKRQILGRQCYLGLGRGHIHFKPQFVV